jgi:hypothetical protein
MMRDGETARVALEWCLLRRPASQALQDRMEKLAKQRPEWEAEKAPRTALPPGRLQKL